MAIPSVEHSQMSNDLTWSASVLRPIRSEGPKWIKTEAILLRHAPHNSCRFCLWKLCLLPSTTTPHPSMAIDSLNSDVDDNRGAIPMNDAFDRLRWSVFEGISNILVLDGLKTLNPDRPVAFCGSCNRNRTSFPIPSYRDCILYLRPSRSPL